MNKLVKGFSTISNLFTKEECQQYINVFETNHEFKKVKYNGRMCHRILTENKEISDEIYKRIFLYLPEYYIDDFGDKWYPKGCNTMIRAIKYTNNCYFDYHNDGYQDFKYNKKTMASVTLTLNTVHKNQGGATVVIDGDEKFHTIHVQPIVGNVFIIEISNGPEHKGEMLQSGVKYILRSDVVCELEHPRNESLRKEYYDLVNQIDQLQQTGWKNNIDKIFACSARISEIEKIY
jgi:hypothetical protein